eukprot:2169537-Lingulodinium_polyedra.AAC.1
MESSAVFPAQAAAVEALRALQTRLYPEWHRRAERAAHLRALLREDKQAGELRALAARPHLRFARGAVASLLAAAQ